MVRVAPIADVSPWLVSVAEVLPRGHRDPAPYALGEAVSELAAYARALTDRSWQKSPATAKTRASLAREIEEQTKLLGPGLRSLLDPTLGALEAAESRSDVVESAARLGDAWREEGAIDVSFDDLCAAAQSPSTTTRALRRLSTILCSQIGPAAHGPLSVLSTAAGYLIEPEEKLARQHRGALPQPLTDERRLELARDALTARPAGAVVAWLVFRRATVEDMQQTAGPMTFFRADWALPNAFGDGATPLKEEAELREIRKHMPWMEDLYTAAQGIKHRLTLVRVDLGERKLAGALDDAQRQVGAVLSLAVEAGGVPWRDAGASALLLNGEVRGGSWGLRLDEAEPPADFDSYGVGVTGTVLKDVAEQLGEALSNGPMPDQLVEALTSLGEARMTDHRAVVFYGERRVSERTATALEDHALELIAAALGVAGQSLAESLQYREALERVDRRLSNHAMAPFVGASFHEGAERARELRDLFNVQGQGLPTFSMARVLSAADDVRELPMSQLQRADFEDAIAIVTDIPSEQRALEEAWLETDLLRARLRRVRNAVNHGLPLHAATIGSVRGYADATSRTALHMAMTWFKSGRTGASVMAAEGDAWKERLLRLESGRSWSTELT